MVIKQQQLVQNIEDKVLILSLHPPLYVDDHAVMFCEAI